MGSIFDQVKRLVSTDEDLGKKLFGSYTAFKARSELVDRFDEDILASRQLFSLVQLELVF